jgi:hypothetical protein
MLALLVGCGGGGDDDDDDDDDSVVDAGDADARTASLDGPCPLDERVGSFVIRHEVEDGFSVAEGSVADKVEPSTVLQLEHEEGGCQFLRKLNPFCDPPCTGGQTCDLSDTCVSAPERLNAGTVTVTGLEAALELAPNDITQDYQDFSIPHPPFAEGATILLSAAGDEVSAFTLDGRGVEPLEIASDVWTMVEGDDFTIEWTSSDGPGEIYVTLNVDLHGNSPVTMHCTFDDTGSATIPASMVQRLVDFGVTVGFASAQIYRRTADRTDISQGCVDLAVQSHINPQFSLQQ